ncbi:hypothetical protein [Kurthia huakuii]|uniref:hypothetical protein n=1 Tax=Kurthia huakuii TaxID=1421019 RepID=UPI0004B97B0F|nr:hypothetical protein [Kurthia huakuii]MBM7701133.1 hypothetical protein [Kurthia huakuii]
MEWSVEGYKEMLHERFSHYTSVVVKGFCDIQQSSFSEEVKMLMLEAFIGEPTIDVQLFFMEDLFDEADVESVEFLEAALVDNWWEQYGDSDEFEEFYEEHELEDVLITELGIWMKACFDKANGAAIKYPLYFGVHDGMAVLDLHTNDWIDPDELEE